MIGTWTAEVTQRANPNPNPATADSGTGAKERAMIEDRGMDPDLVGPGAYAIWKKTPAYREWRMAVDSPKNRVLADTHRHEVG